MSRSVCILAAAVTVCAACWCPVGLALTPSQQKDVAELVRRLGDESFRIREEASSQLLKLGLEAKPFLQEGMQSPDEEIRRRCRELLPAMFQADFQARVLAFLADKEGKHDPNLPGWKRFRTMAGNDAAARALFAEILTSDAGRFLAECEARPEGAGAMVQNRAQFLQQQLYEPERRHQPVSLGEVTTLLLISSDERVHVPLQAIYIINSFFYQPSIRAAVSRPTSSSPFKRLLLSWMNDQTDPRAIQQVLYMAMSLELKEALGVALKVIDGNTAKGFQLTMALVTIGKLGDKGHLKLFDRYLQDTTLIGQFNNTNLRGTTEVRDVALAMMIHLTGQRHRDYGFAFAKNGMGLQFRPFNMGFSTQHERQNAFQKWQAYVAAKAK